MRKGERSCTKIGSQDVVAWSGACMMGPGVFAPELYELAWANVKHFEWILICVV